MSALPGGREWRSVVALSGGVGGARFLEGLARALPEGALTAVVNTGDDFEHWGLHVSPDLDTVMYTLAGLSHEERGWGLADETFHALAMVTRYGGDDWFALGDADLATHVLRTQALARGDSLSDVTARLCSALGVRARVLPMADGACRTMVDTAHEGTLTFQDWFVRRHAEPPLRRVWWKGLPSPAPSVLPAIERADLILVGPSNPYVSIDPILSLPGVRPALARARARAQVIAISPIVGGQAVKGPLARMIPELTGQPPSAAAIALHYEGLLSGIVVERGDEAGIAGVAVLGTDTVMRRRDDRLRVAVRTLEFAAQLAAATPAPAGSGSARPG